MSQRSPLNLPQAPAEYDQTYQRNLMSALIKADANSVKKDEEWNPVRLVLQDTVTMARYQVTVVSGVLTVTAL